VRFLVQSYGLIRNEVMTLAPRKTLEELQTLQQKEQTGNLQKLFQQELLKALQGGDSTRRALPTQRDTQPAVGPRPRINQRNNN
jgi:hypothetical protein